MNRTRSDPSDDEGDGTRVPVDELLADGPDDAGASTPCAACGDAEATHTLVLTVDWIDYLADRHGVDPPDEIPRAPLCVRCRSWAEMIEIAELDLSSHGPETRERIREERARFLDLLDVRLIDQFGRRAVAGDLD